MFGTPLAEHLKMSSREPENFFGFLLVLSLCLLCPVELQLCVQASFSFFFFFWPAGCYKMLHVLVNRQNIMIWRESNTTTHEETRLCHRYCRLKVALL